MSRLADKFLEDETLQLHTLKVEKLERILNGLHYKCDSNREYHWAIGDEVLRAKSLVEIRVKELLKEWEER